MSEKVQQRQRVRAKRIKIGTIIEIPAKSGYVYVQYFYETRAYGAYLRVFRGIFQERPSDFVALANQKEQFIANSCAFRYDLNDGLSQVVGWAPVPERLQKLPFFKQLWGGVYTLDPSPYYWILKDHETHRRWKIGSETYDRQKVGKILPKKYHHLPTCKNISIECLIDKVEMGWTHESDTFELSDWEIFRQRIQEQIASEKPSVPHSQPVSTSERPASPRPNPIAKPLQKLLTHMDRIMDKHEELGDTDVREQLHEVIQNAFVHAKADYVLPEGFGMFTKAGNKRVHSALTTFLKKAPDLASKAGLCSDIDRLMAFQDIEVTSENGSTYDDYFGDCEPLAAGSSQT